MSKYFDELTKMATAQAAATPTLGQSEINSLLQAEMKNQQEIDTYTTQMAPLRETDAGQKALQGLVATQDAPKQERAAAAQALNPGLKASVGNNGELSFSAAPGADLGFNYPDKTNKGFQTKATKAEPEATNFGDTFTKLQGLTDPTEIANTYASANASATSWLQSRTAQLTQQVGQSHGLQQLQSQLEADKIADQDYYNKYYGGVNQGPTDESIKNIQLFAQTQAKVQAEVEDKLKLDPQAASIKTQLTIMGNYVNQKVSDSLIGTTQKTQAAVNLIPPQSIDATATALGKNPAALTPQEKEAIALGISSSNRVYTEAMNIGMASPPEVAVIAFSGSGAQSEAAKRVLNSKFSADSQTPKALEQGYRNFDKDILPTLHKDVQESLKVPATATGKEKAQAQQRIENQKMGLVIQNLSQKRTIAFENSVGQWDAPQDPLLAEVQTIRQDLLAKDPKANIRIDQIMQRMDFKTGGQAKIDAMSKYISSQAGQLADNDFFGAPIQYANEVNSRAMVQTLAVKSMTTNIQAPAIYSYPQDNFGAAQ